MPLNTARTRVVPFDLNLPFALPVASVTALSTVFHDLPTFFWNTTGPPAATGP
jgi:hypothetical protein